MVEKYRIFFEKVKISTLEYANVFSYIDSNDIFLRKIKGIEYSNKKQINKVEELARKFADQININQTQRINKFIIGSNKIYKKYIYLVDKDGLSSSLLDLEYLIELFENMNIEFFIDSRTDTLYWNIRKREKTMTLS